MTLGTAKLDYCDLLERIENLAQHLKDKGCGAGSRMLLDIPLGQFEWVIGLLAGLASGSAVVLLDPHFSRQDRLDCLKELQPGFALLPGGLIQRTDLPPIPAREGPGIWLFTSGTTARPRPQFRSEAVLVRQAARVRDRIPGAIVATRPASLSITPLCHGYGLLNALLLIHSLGGTVALAGDASDEELIRLIHAQNIRVLYAWPADFDRLGQRRLWPRLTTDQLQWCVSSSMRLTTEVSERFQLCSGCAIRQQYGTTETGPISVDSEPSPRGSDCMGLPLEGVHVEILGPHGSIQPAWQEGRVAVMMDSAEDPDFLRRARYFPGDLGMTDDAGRLYIRRRMQPFFDERTSP